ncbi:glycosyltransferase [Motilibacter deserti]|uniref:Glycosyltransferase n=1 Tax=Motilibacter deserti TaxID=2714956 RepID=A0ABX0GRD7_9ACTN|nr:glycosyltransferase [Motilibacter deserti]NHC13422.1 glycosyltransferase [Motilibacter deserti]
MSPHTSPGTSNGIVGVTGCPPYSARLRVLHVVGTADPQLREFVDAVARHQQAGGWDVSVASPTPAGPADGWHEWPVLDTPRAVPAAVASLRPLLSGVDPEVLVLHGAGAGTAGRLAARGDRPTVYVPHRTGFFAGGRRLRPVDRLWERRACGWTSALVLLDAAQAMAATAAGMTAPQFVLSASAETVDGSYAALAAIVARAHVFGTPAVTWSPEARGGTAPRP